MLLKNFVYSFSSYPLVYHIFFLSTLFFTLYLFFYSFRLLLSTLFLTSCLHLFLLVSVLSTCTPFLHLINTPKCFHVTMSQSWRPLAGEFSPQVQCKKSFRSLGTASVCVVQTDYEWVQAATSSQSASATAWWQALRGEDETWACLCAVFNSCDTNPELCF